MSHYRLSALYYDDIYAAKDYAGEVARLLNWLRERDAQPSSVLDLACGSGRHLEALASHGLECQGLDLEPGLLELARRRLPDVVFQQANMAEVSGDEQYELITCWFGSVGYLRDLPTLRQAVLRWAALLRPGGWLGLEPWLDAGVFQAGRIFTDRVEKPDFHLVRMAVSRSVDRLYSTDFHYLLGTVRGVEHFVERHELYMFSREEYTQALREAGLEVHYEPSRVAERGMFLAHKPRAAGNQVVFP